MLPRDSPSGPLQATERKHIIWRHVSGNCGAEQDSKLLSGFELIGPYLSVARSGRSGLIVQFHGECVPSWSNLDTRPITRARCLTVHWREQPFHPTIGVPNRSAD